MICGFARSFLVIDCINAIWRLKIFSSMPPESATCFCIFFMPGIIPMMPSMPPIFIICSSCIFRSFILNIPFFMRFIIFSACSTSMVSWAFSTSDTISPMPKIRPATRSGWNSSNASIFSPRPTNLIGRPVTARMDNAAPPRPSPSIRVRTTPEMPMRSSKFSAV